MAKTRLGSVILLLAVGLASSPSTTSSSSPSDFGYARFRRASSAMITTIDSCLETIQEQQRLFGLIDVSWAHALTATVQDANDLAADLFSGVESAALTFSRNTIGSSCDYMEELIVEHVMRSTGGMTDQEEAALRGHIREYMGWVESGSMAAVEQSVEAAMSEMTKRASPTKLGEQAFGVLVANSPKYLSAFKGAVLTHHYGLSAGLKSAGSSALGDLNVAGFGHLGAYAAPALIAAYLADATGAGEYAQLARAGSGKLMTAKALMLDCTARSDERNYVARTYDLYRAMRLTREAIELFLEAHEALGGQGWSSEKADVWRSLLAPAVEVEERLRTRVADPSPHVAMKAEQKSGGEWTLVFFVENQGGMTGDGFLSVSVSDGLAIAGYDDVSGRDTRTEFRLYPQNSAINDRNWRKMESHYALLDIVGPYDRAENKAFRLIVGGTGRRDGEQWVKYRLAFQSLADQAFIRAPTRRGAEVVDQQGWPVYEERIVLNPTSDANRTETASGIGRSGVRAECLCHWIWQVGAEPWQVMLPHDVAVDSQGCVYVTDSRYHCVRKFTGRGSHIQDWGRKGSGTGEFSNPRGIAVDADGNVYVADGGNRRIQKFRSDGTFVACLGSWGSGRSRFSWPGAVAVDGDGSIFVADLIQHRIQKLDREGVFLTEWGEEGSGDGEFEEILDIAVDAGGNVYATDPGNNCVQKFTNEGDFLAKWGRAGTGDGEFRSPGGLVVDSRNNIYVADIENHRVQVFTADGAFLSKWGFKGSQDGDLSLPMGVALDNVGNCYVAEAGNARVQKFGFVRR